MQLIHNGPSAYGVVAFAETANASPRFVWAVHLDARREVETLLWTAHSQLVGAFGAWLAGLEQPPVSDLLLGGGVLLNEKTARGAAGILRQGFGLPDLPRDHRRPVCRIERDGRLETFNSVASAAEANGVSRARIGRCLHALTIRHDGIWI